MSRGYMVRLRKRKRSSGRLRPQDVFAFMREIVEAVDNATIGGSAGLIRRIDRVFDHLTKKSEVSAQVLRFLRLTKRLGKGPKLRVLDSGEAGTYLKPRTGSFKEFPVPAETRRTGGVREARALEFEDGSVEFEMAGTILESITDLRKPQSIPSLGVASRGLDFSRDLKPPGQKVYKGVSLADFDRAHLWGHGFGDEARAGIMYAPSAFNRIWQNLGIEDRIRKSAESVRAQGGEFILRAKARRYPPEETWKRGALRTKDQEFLLEELVYEIEVRRADGSVVTGSISFEIPPPGSRDPIVPEFFGTDLLLFAESPV